MGISINIDETIRKPNVRPPAPVSKRGPITFFVDIEESNGRDLRRNLTRGVDATDDTPVPIPPPTDRNVALQTLLLSLSVSSEFPLNVEIPLSSVIVDLTLPDIQTLAPEQIDLSTISVELTNLIGISNGLVVTDDEFLSLTLPELGFVSPIDVSLSSINVDLTIPQVETRATGNQSRALDNLIIALTNELETRNAIDAGVISIDLTNELETQAEVAFETVSVDLSLQEFEVEVGGDLDIPGIDLTLPAIETEATNDLNLSPVNVDLTVDIETTAPNTKALDNLIVDLSLDIGTDITEQFDPITVDLSLEIDTSVETALDRIDVVLTNETSIEVGANTPEINVELSLIDGFDNALNLQTLEAALSIAETLDVGINIQLPDNMVSTPDDAPPIP
jgi:hypothetical protein